MRKCPECGKKLKEDAHKLKVFCSARCGLLSWRKQNRERYNKNQRELRGRAGRDVPESGLPAKEFKKFCLPT